MSQEADLDDNNDNFRSLSSHGLILSSRLMNVALFVVSFLPSPSPSVQLTLLKKKNIKNQTATTTTLAFPKT